MSRSREVDSYMVSLDHWMAAQVETLRSAILGADPRVKESIKWNAPSFSIDEHFATFNLHSPDRVMIVLHTGAKVNPGARHIDVDDPEKLLKWAAADRASVTFSSPSDVDEKLAGFVAVLKQWIRKTT